MTPTLRHRLEHAAVRALDGLVRVLPNETGRQVGRGLGALAFLGRAGERNAADAELRAAFPELDAGARRRLVRASFEERGAAHCDALAALRLDPVAFCRRLTLDGWQHLNDAEAHGRGVVLLGARFGRWQITDIPVGLYRDSLDVVLPELPNPLLRRDWQRRCLRFGGHPVTGRDDARELLATLRGRGRVSLLLERTAPDAGGVETPFLGRTVTFDALAARLALDDDVPVVPILGFPEARGTFRVALRPAIYPDNLPGAPERAAAELTRRFAAALEQEIRQRPDLWSWGR